MSVKAVSLRTLRKSKELSQKFQDSRKVLSSKDLMLS